MLYHLDNIFKGMKKNIEFKLLLFFSTRVVFLMPLLSVRFLSVVTCILGSFLPNLTELVNQQLIFVKAAIMFTRITIEWPHSAPFQFLSFAFRLFGS